ncbi:NADPH-dependent FMN reductase [Antrihabitans cavernicola]|uniref:NAD(P)H-dependent oxidoreductase n=1 Tax=Antrihabitans cavernicola TaxID=2495913 RepID=A0A5A7SE31_9NOCA|nr:NAD(P)H-dependent oxidoreductase [Spelaeibacter cavernicola]KAA0023462.1 NAD(P)H-dependent oxidoreductase [Spelaeibacter cavernicola]
MIRIAVITGSTRPERRATMVSDWVAATAAQHAAVRDGTVELESVDLAAYDLPLLDESAPAKVAPNNGGYANAHTRVWAEAIASYDGFVFVTPEYNHSFPAALKNAIDYLYDEWNDKAAGFVSYGIQGGTRAVEHLRPVLSEVEVATVRTQVALTMSTDFQLADPLESGTLTPGSHQVPTLHAMLDELIAWSTALAALRSGRLEAALL